MRKAISCVAAAGLALGFLLLGASGAEAAPIVYQLTAGNSAISGFAGPYADVTVDLTSSTTATITFTSNTVAGNTYLFGDSSSAAVNVNATSWTLGGLSASNSGTGFTTPSLSDSGSANVDSFGVFNQTVKDFDGLGHSADTLQFTITNTSGTWANASSVLAANANGNVAAAHIFVCADTSPGACDASVPALATGYTSQLPEPSALALLLIGGSMLAAGRQR